MKMKNTLFNQNYNNCYIELYKKMDYYQHMHSIS